MFTMAVVALLMAISGYRRVAEDADPDFVLYRFEIGLPALLFAGLMWAGIKQWREDRKA